MTLDYIENTNEYGDNIIRLYDFDKSQAIQFRTAIQKSIIKSKKPLELTATGFIEGRNCNLTLRIAEEDAGIQASDNMNFYCDLTLASYEQMITLLKPFCNKETRGYQWLYDVDTEIDFLFSPAGTW